VQIKFKDWSLNQPLIAPNGYENPASTANKACLALALGKKLLLSLSLLFFFLFILLPKSRRQNINKNQTL
jgi:hypothetical protein